MATIDKRPLKAFVRFDGTGRVVSVFISGGFYNDPGNLVSAGFYNTSSWDNTWDGGIAIDNFN